MTMEEFEVVFYEKADGTFPAEEFIMAQEAKMQTKLLRQIFLLRRAGNKLREPDSKFLTDGIFELRAIQGNTIARVLYFFVIGKKIVLTNGFIKKTDKTPPLEIAKAQKYREDYLQRKGMLTDGKRTNH